MGGGGAEATGEDSLPPSNPPTTLQGRRPTGSHAPTAPNRGPRPGRAAGGGASELAGNASSTVRRCPPPPGTLPSGAHLPGPPPPRAISRRPHFRDPRAPPPPDVTPSRVRAGSGPRCPSAVPGASRLVGRGAVKIPALIRGRQPGTTPAERPRPRGKAPPRDRTPPMESAPAQTCRRVLDKP